MLLFCGLAGLAGCTAVSIGVWRDDPENWSRAFGGIVPSSSIVHHSVYSRTELGYSYYFELEDCKVTRDVVGMYGRLKITDLRVKEIALDQDCPSWFLMEVADENPVYKDPKAPGSFVVFDLNRGHVFIHHREP